MTPEQLQTLAINPAMSLLPAKMDSPEARVMLIAIALQESRIKYRRQIKGPARGFWQFERGGGVRGVLSHRSTARLSAEICAGLSYEADSAVVYAAISDNDVLACVMARLLLWTLPQALPRTSGEGWQQYISAWRPGKPHESTWGGFFERARAAV